MPITTARPERHDILVRPTPLVEEIVDGGAHKVSTTQLLNLGYAGDMDQREEQTREETASVPRHQEDPLPGHGENTLRTQEEGQAPEQVRFEVIQRGAFYRTGLPDLVACQF